MEETPLSPAACSEAVISHYRIKPAYLHTGNLVCGRTCVQELESIGQTPDGLNIPAKPCLGPECEQAPVVEALQNPPAAS